jgi:hypothetical protein
MPTSEDFPCLALNSIYQPDGDVFVSPATIHSTLQLPAPPAPVNRTPTYGPPPVITISSQLPALTAALRHLVPPPADQSIHSILSDISRLPNLEDIVIPAGLNFLNLPVLGKPTPRDFGNITQLPRLPSVSRAAISQQLGSAPFYSQLRQRQHGALWQRAR